MSRHEGVGQLIPALSTGVTLVALPGGFRVLNAALADVGGLTRGAGDRVWTASGAYCLLTLHRIIAAS
jgi:hypothetical protein